MSDPGEITSRQRSVLTHLLNGEPVNRAAKLARVSERQVYRWLKLDPEFKSTIRQAQGVMLDGVGLQLVTLASDAVEVLARLLSNPPSRSDAPGAGVQLRAAVAVLDACLRWREVVDFEDRLSALEAASHEKPG
jgi:hypothetical protein